MPSATPKRKVGRPPNAEQHARRAEEILAAATRLIAAEGYSNADTQLLADQLQIGKGTLFRYFPTKQALFLATVDRAMQRLKAAVDQQVEQETDPLRSVARGIHAYLGFFDENRQFVELLIQERAQFKDRRKPTYFQHRDANLGPWQELFRQLIAAGRVREMRAERITSILSNLVYGTMFTNYFAGRDEPLEHQADDILEIVFHGILTGDEKICLRSQAEGLAAKERKGRRR